MIYYLGMKSNKTVSLLNTDVGEMKHVSSKEFFSKITEGNLSRAQLLNAAKTNDELDATKLDKLIKKDIYIDNREDIINNLLYNTKICYYLGKATGTLMYVLNSDGVAETVYRINNDSKVLNSITYNMVWPSKDNNYDGVFTYSPSFTYTCESRLSYAEAKEDLKSYVMPDIEQFQNNCLLLGTAGLLGTYSESKEYPGALTWKCTKEQIKSWVEENKGAGKAIKVNGQTLYVYEINILEGVTVLEPHCFDIDGRDGSETIIYLKFPESLTFIAPNAFTPTERYIAGRRVVIDLSKTAVSDIVFNSPIEKTKSYYKCPRFFILPKGIQSISGLGNTGIAVLTSRNIRQIVETPTVLVFNSALSNDDEDDNTFDLEYLGKDTLAPYYGHDVDYCAFFEPLVKKCTPLFDIPNCNFPKLRQIDGNALIKCMYIRGYGLWNNNYVLKLYGAPLNYMTKGMLTNLRKSLDTYAEYTHMEFKLSFSKGCTIDKKFNFEHSRLDYKNIKEFKDDEDD